MHPYSPIRVIDARRAIGSDSILLEVETGRNFIVVVKDLKDLEDPCKKLLCQLDRFERLHKWGIHGLADVLELRDYRELMAAHRDYGVYLIEQLNLRVNVPRRR